MKTLTLFALMGVPSLLHAAACVPDTLANYVSLGVAGCTVGQFTFKNFDLSTVSSSVGYLPAPPSAVNVTPSQGATSLNLRFSSNSWTVSGSETVTYLLRYDVDPPPIIIRAFEDDLFDESTFAFRAAAVSGGGKITVTTDLCIGNVYAAGVCNPPGTPSPSPITVFDFGTSAQFVDSRTFAPVNMLGVRDTIKLEALGGSASMSALGNGTMVAPEPAAFLLFGSGLLALLMRRVRSKIH